MHIPSTERREPFAAKRYEFGHCRMTERNSSYIGTMLKGRLTPPPRSQSVTQLISQLLSVLPS